jgi:hypothetical protein
VGLYKEEMMEISRTSGPNKKTAVNPKLSSGSTSNLAGSFVMTQGTRLQKFSAKFGFEEILRPENGQVWRPLRLGGGFSGRKSTRKGSTERKSA